MKKITYTLIVIVILLILIVFIWPYIMGASLRNQIFGMSKKGGLPNNAKLKIINYHTGWLSSKMNLQLTLPASALTNTSALKNDKSLVMNVKLDVANGPIAKLNAAISGKKWGWGRGAASGTITLITPSIKDLPNAKFLSRPIAVEGWFHWSGTIDMYATLPGGDFYTSKKMKFSSTSGNITAHIAINKTFNKISAKLLIPNIHANQQGLGELNISSLNYATHAKKGLAGLWYGNTQTRVPQISIVKDQQNLAQVQNVTIKKTLELNKNNDILSHILAKIDKLNVMGQQTVGPFTLDFSVNNVQPKAIAGFQNKIKKIAADFLKNPNAKWSKKEQDQLDNKQLMSFFNALQPAVVSVLTGTHMTLNNLELTSPMGSAKATGMLMLPDQINGAITDPNAILNLALSSQASLQLTVAEPIVYTTATLFGSPEVSKNNMPGNTPKSAGQILQQLAAYGLIKHDKGNYKASLRYQNRALTLGGKSLIEAIKDLQKIGLLPGAQQPKTAINSGAKGPTKKPWIEKNASQKASTRTAA